MRLNKQEKQRLQDRMMDFLKSVELRCRAIGAPQRSAPLIHGLLKKMGLSTLSWLHFVAV